MQDRVETEERQHKDWPGASRGRCIIECRSHVMMANYHAPNQDDDPALTRPYNRQPASHPNIDGMHMSWDSCV